MDLQPILLMAPLLWAAAMASDLGDLGDPAMNFTLDPFCDILDDYSMIGCYLIDAGSTDVLSEALQNATDWEAISLLLAFSAITELPADLLAEAKLASLAFDLNCSLDGVPSTLLRGLSSPLLDLQFVNVGGLKRIAAGDLDGTAFGDSLESIVLQVEELSDVEEAAFHEFVALKTLIVSKTAVRALPAGTLQGLGALDEVTLTYNPVTSLPNGFFAGQGLLRNAWLGQNQLVALEEGSLDGLDAIQILNVAGNPFHCNCTLQWFKDWLTVRDLLDASGATCATPTSGKFAEVDFCV